MLVGQKLNGGDSLPYLWLLLQTGVIFLVEKLLPGSDFSGRNAFLLYTLENTCYR